jgi:hypothetical protein
MTMFDFEELRGMFTGAREQGVLIRLTYQGLSLTSRHAAPDNIPWSVLKTLMYDDVIMKIVKYAMLAERKSCGCGYCQRVARCRAKRESKGNK